MILPIFPTLFLYLLSGVFRWIKEEEEEGMRGAVESPKGLTKHQIFSFLSVKKIIFRAKHDGRDFFLPCVQ